MQAIETHYQGYRFRSRLEARWAVFMDTAGIEWRYEPEGFRILVDGESISYLPDFWLGTGQWGEVKGHLEHRDYIRLTKLATGMGGCGVASAADMVVLGNIPRQGSCLWPVQLHFHGKLWAVPWGLEPGCPLDRPRIRLARYEEAMGVKLLIDGFPAGAPVWAVDALNRARGARFEWGESG